MVSKRIDYGITKEWLSRKYIQEQLNQRELAEMVGCSRKVIRSRLDEWGIQRRANSQSLKISHSKRDSHWKHKLDERCFALESMTEQSYYFLGYIFADGCLEESHWSLSASSIDREVLDGLGRLLKWTGEPYACKPTRFTKHQLYKVNIYSKQIYHNLLDWGLCPNKSDKMVFPDLSCEALPHFVRGYFDGDGYIGVYGRYTFPVHISFVSNSREFLESLRKRVEICAGISLPKVAVMSNGRAWNIQASCGSAMTFCNWMYAYPGPRLKRKYEKYLSACPAKPMRIVLQ